jgi:hypothetical protein
MLESFAALAEFDVMAILVNSGDLFNLKLEAYADNWYPEIPDPLEIDLSDLVINVSSYGMPSERDQSLFPVYVPVPFFSPVPDGAAVISVIDGEETADINFELKLGALQDMVDTPVEETRSEKAAPVQFSLSQNYPNPFNPSTSFAFSLPKRGFVELAVHDLLGRRVRTLIHKEVHAGTHSGLWDGRDGNGAVMPSGIYLIRLFWQDQVQVIKTTLIR